MTSSATQLHYRGADGARLCYRAIGTGPVTVTCLHSLALDGTWYVPLIARLDPTYRYLCPDFRGHGYSERGHAELTMGQLVADIVALWDHIGLESGAVMGISLGGRIVQGLIRQAPARISVGIIMCTSGNPTERSRVALAERAAVAGTPEGMADTVEATLRRWFSDTAIAAAAAGDPVSRARSALQHTDPGVHSEYLAAMGATGFLDDSPAWQTPPPVLVVGGAGDRSTSISAVAELAHSIRGARLVTVPGGHLSAFAEPDEVAPVISEFLTEHVAPARHR